ncbi:MAG: DUF3285 domain-containing protein [Cyanobacteria bacterium P01_G01_bin.54]
MTTQPTSESPTAGTPISPDTTPQVPTSQTTEPQTTEPQPSYTKLAMRNMVRKKGKSLTHFFLSTLAVVSLLVGLAYLTR